MESPWRVIVGYTAGGGILDVSALDPGHTVIHPTAFVARGAAIVGDVHIGADASVWFNAVVRGDMAPIRIGDRSNVQDGSVLHVDDDCPLVIGNNVTIGHLCIIHGCTIGQGSLIGMGSILMNGVVLGEDCLVGAGSLLTENKVFPPRSVIVGRPARVIREILEHDLPKLRHGTEHYVEAARAYRARGLDARETP